MNDTNDQHPPSPDAQPTDAPGDGEDASTVWLVSYADDDDRELRPPQIAEALRLGEINADTIVWRQGADDWLPLANVPELAKLLSASGETATAPLVAPVPALLRAAMKPATDTTAATSTTEATAVKTAPPSTKPMLAGRSVPTAKGTTRLGMPKLDPKKDGKTEVAPVPKVKLETTPIPVAKAVSPGAPDMTPTVPKSPAALVTPTSSRASASKAAVFGSPGEDEEAPISIEPEFLRPPSPAPARAMQRAKALSAGTLGLKQPAPPPRPPQKSVPEIELPKKSAPEIEVPKKSAPEIEVRKKAGPKQPAPPPRPPQKSVPEIELPKKAELQPPVDPGTPSLGTLAAPVRDEPKRAPGAMLNAEELLQRAVALDGTGSGATAEPEAPPTVEVGKLGAEPVPTAEDEGVSPTPTESTASVEPPAAKGDAKTDAPISEARPATAAKPAARNPWPMLAAAAAVVLLGWVFMRGKRDPEPNQANLETRTAAPNVAEPTTAAPVEPKAPEPTPETPEPAMTAATEPADEQAKSTAPAAAKETHAAPAAAGAGPTETSGAAKETKTASKPAEVRPAEARPAAAAAEPKEVAVGGEFDRAAAATALGGAAQEASGCRKEGDPSGVAVVHLTFSNAGRATRAVIEGPPFAGTQTGGCIAATLRKATVPPYGGDRVTVTKKVIIH